VSGVTHLNPLQIFMPVIVAFHLILISTTGALVYTFQRNYFIALVTCLVLSFTALTALGTFYQLITQVIGLSVLIASVILLCQSFNRNKKLDILTQSILLGSVLSSLIILYVELVPFLVAICFIYFAISTWQGWRPNKKFSLIILFSIMFVLVILNTHLLASLEFIVREYAVMAEAAKYMVFPYFLMPSGLANFWGLIGLTVPVQEPLLSIAIIISLLLDLVVIVLAVRLVFVRKSLPAIVLLVMFCLGVNLFIKNIGFGLFKLVMYVQPFLISVVTISIFEFIKNQYAKIGIILVLILVNCNSFIFYLNRSKGETPGSFTEIAYGSLSKINKEYRALISEIPRNSLLLTDDYNISLIRLQAAQSFHLRFIPLTSPGNFIVRALDPSLYLFSTLHSKLFFSDQAKKIADTYYKNSFYMGNFNLHSKTEDSSLDFMENKFNSNTSARKQGFIVSDTNLRSIFNNHFNENTYKTNNFSLNKLDDIKNHLVFIDSTLGGSYHSTMASHIKNISLYNLESDPMYPHSNMQAVGRYLLMRVFNPTKKVRLVISLTKTYGGDGKNELPMISVIGNKRVNVSLMGRGSARIVSDLFIPQIINNVPYIATDMNNEAAGFISKKEKILNLYNKDIQLDQRKVAAFVRDISLISETEYRKLNPPSVIKDFPKDLANHDLLYSGIYEDGWISEDAFFQIKQPSLNKELVIEGSMPKIDPEFAGSKLLVSIDTKNVVDLQLQAGEFKIHIPVKNNIITHRVELHFSQKQRLPRGDDRLVAAQIKYLGFM
jgi:hypothetical protein